MTNSIYDQYLQTEILSADPMTLVRILYRGAIEAVAAARRHLKDGAIRERSDQITKACEIVNELMVSLDHERGGEISRDLRSIYVYMQTRLLEANLKQIDPPLAEVERLLSTLLDGWRAAVPAASVANPLEEVYAPVSCTY